MFVVRCLGNKIDSSVARTPEIILIDHRKDVSGRISSNSHHDTQDVTVLEVHQKELINISSQLSSSFSFTVSVGGVSFPFMSAFKSLNKIRALVNQFQWLTKNRNVHVDLNQLFEHLAFLARTFNRVHAISKAIETNKNFSWPTEALVRDAQELRQCGYIQTLARKRLDETFNTMFNTDKVLKFFKEDIEFTRLLDIANGVVVETPSEFNRNSAPTEF